MTLLSLEPFGKYLLYGTVALIISSLSTSCRSNVPVSRQFVEVSNKNPHYFALSGGEAYIPVGCNIAALGNREAITHYVTSLADNGANFGRVWLNSAIFEIETEYGKLNDNNLSNIIYLLDLASERGVKIKLCIESFRHIRPGRNRWDTKASHHVSNGGLFENSQEYISTQKGRDDYLRRLGIIKEHVGNHPAVFGWELWNEMNAVECNDIQEWNEYMLPKVKQMFPKNLVMQSLGSLDRASSYPTYENICKLPYNEVSQVHRYLDTGAEAVICHAPMDSLCSDAVKVLMDYNLDKPVLLAEGGAVMPNHAGPSKLYKVDTLGVLLHDVIFTPFFCGAAGSGHCWHWDHYIDKNNLWYHFKRFKRAIDGINPIKECFEPVRCDVDSLKGYGLKGKRHMLIWYRDSKNDWNTEFVEGRKPDVIDDAKIKLTDIIGDKKIKKISVYNPWNDTEVMLDGASDIVLPGFCRSVVVKVAYK